MLTEKEIIEKLHEYAREMKRTYGQKNYNLAKWHYTLAFWTAFFVEIDEGLWRELFGERKEKGVYEVLGEFPEELYLKACDMWRLGEKKAKTKTQ